MQTKICTKCKKEKPINRFRKNKYSKLGLRSVCRACDGIYNKDYKKNKYLRYKYTMREVRLRKKYGISLDDFARMEIKQNHRCAICGKKESRKSNKKQYVAALCVDHDHETGKVRGLLCHWCNIKLGVVEDNEFNRKAKEYLKSSS